MSFGLPDEFDDWVYFQLLVIFLIGFCINVYSNGQATLFFIEDYYDSNIEEVEINQINTDLDYNLSSVKFDETSHQSIIDKYRKDSIWKSKWAMYIAKFLYFVVSPLINFYFAFFIFKDGLRWEKKVEKVNNVRFVKTKTY